MCTLILCLDPGSRWPAVMAATRDEFRSRRWQPPSEWWPDRHPQLIGGRDLQGGGTWLAVDSARSRAAIVLNRIEQTGLTDREAGSRGSLPLLAAGRGAEAVDRLDPRLLRPFNLVLAESGTATSVALRRHRAQSRHEIHPGLHILTAADLDDMRNPRQRHWLPKFRDAAPPSRPRRRPGPRRLGRMARSCWRTSTGPTTTHAP